MSDQLSASEKLKHEQFMIQQKNMALTSYQKAVSAYSNYIAQTAAPDRGAMLDREDRKAKKMLAHAVRAANKHWAGFGVMA